MLRNEVFSSHKDEDEVAAYMLMNKMFVAPSTVIINHYHPNKTLNAAFAGKIKTDNR